MTCGGADSANIANVENDEEDENKEGMGGNWIGEKKQIANRRERYFYENSSGAKASCYYFVNTRHEPNSIMNGNNPLERVTTHPNQESGCRSPPPSPGDCCRIRNYYKPHFKP